MWVPLPCGDLLWEMQVEEMLFKQGEVVPLCQQIQLKTGFENRLAVCVAR
jgi:hypothetical protein